MLDRADLDFGIYRIMNVKREEIAKFLERDLLPQVKAALNVVDDGQRAQVKEELDKALEAATRIGADPETNSKIAELRARYNAGTDLDSLENEVFSHLASFFRRYYKEGDFLSLRRYKEGVYAIPYEGEEVKLHWANADQYYIKSSEQFRDYTFRLPDDRRVHFKIASASVERDNNQAASGQERRFLLADNDAVTEVDGELVIRFEYKSDTEGHKREAINTDSEARIVGALPEAWKASLSAKAQTEKNPDRTLLAKHLADYTARNTFDYFIHKDLGGFLRRELDFYIKNEVMNLDDIESETAPRVEQYLAKIRAIRQIAHKIIDFLAQLEDFQKKLWLKKKFVVETNYCVTLNRLPEELYTEIAVNDLQRQEWIRLFAIDDLAGFTEPLSVSFLKENSSLIVDSSFFDERFRSRLLASLNNLSEDCDGILVHSENFQALNLLREEYAEAVKCIYIDPPYNTSSSAIPYKNDYKHSSWATMMQDRLQLLRHLMPQDGAIFVSIDKTERNVLDFVMDNVFGAGNRIEELIWSMNTTNSQLPNYSTNHEYIQVYAKHRPTAEQDPSMFREPKPGYIEVMTLVKELNPQFPSAKEMESSLRDLYQKHKIEFREEIEAAGLDWEKEQTSDPWKGLYNYSHAEYRDEQGNLVDEREAKSKAATVWIWQEGDASMPATKQASSTRDPQSPNWRFYTPSHPATGKACPHPKSGWKFAYADDEDSPDRRSFVSLDKDSRIAWGTDEKKVPRIKRMLHEVETNIGKSVFQDYSDGEKQTSAMFGRSGVFLAPKHSSFVSRFIQHAAKPNSVILDCFGGSGSTAQAVIELNQTDRGRRKYVLVEMGEYFQSVLKPRVLKAAYSNHWRAGKPVTRPAVSHCIKVLRLESYEDTLNNLKLARTPTQASLLEEQSLLNQDYVLRYMLEVEAKDSPSLLNLTSFEDPFDYRLDISTSDVGQTKSVAVDLVETFNYLIGLRVRSIDTIAGFRVVTGESPSADRVLIIWRNLRDKSNADLDAFFRKQDYRTLDREFDIIYVNGDNNLENLRREDETWKVRLIEEEFLSLMFDVRDL